MLVPRIGTFKQISSGVYLQQQIDKVLQLEIGYARRDVDAVAGVKPHPVRRDSAQGVIDRIDA